MKMRRIAALAGLIAVNVTSSACAQGPGQRLSVEVTPMAVEAHGDTIRMTYSVKNSASSQEPVFVLSLDVPMGVISLAAPGDPGDWSLGRSYRGKKVAEWGVLGSQLDPGKQVDSLAFSAIGIFGTTTATVGGYFPPTPLPTEAEMRANPALATDPDPRTAQALHFQVPGIVPAPAGGNGGLFAALKRDEATVCASPNGAIRGLCRSLDAKLQAAEAALGRGNSAAALGPLGAFVNELTTPATAKAQLGQTYWLLLGNAKALIARLGGS